MRLISRLREPCYCAFCKAPRRVYSKQHIDLTNVLCALLFAGAVTFASWSSPDARGIFVFFAFCVGAEIFVYMRWRMAIVCSLCGFDPVVYKKSPQRASDRVKRFFAEQVENPEFWLTKSPLLRVQKQIRENEKKAIEKQIITNRAKT